MNNDSKPMKTVTTLPLNQLLRALADAEMHAAPEESIRFSVFKNRDDDLFKLELNRGADGKWTLAHPVLLMP